MKRAYVKPEVIASANGSLEGVFAHRGGFGGGGNPGGGNPGGGNPGGGNPGGGNGRPGWGGKDNETIEESSSISGYYSRHGWHYN